MKSDSHKPVDAKASGRVVMATVATIKNRVKSRFLEISRILIMGGVRKGRKRYLLVYFKKKAGNTKQKYISEGPGSKREWNGFGERLWDNEQRGMVLLWRACLELTGAGERGRGFG